ncbi:MAG: nSTAND1 domain-containing NTPase [Solirubrobacteraceae bacterium]
MTTVAAPPEAAEAASGPYVGLTFYTQDKAAMFFGRESERKVLIGNLRASRLTLLYAGSGVGKSSLLRAGVASRLSELADRSVQELGSPRNIPVVFSSWRDDPTDDLMEEILRSTSRFLSPELLTNVEGHRLVDLLEAISRTTDATVLVILDQFEEYFLYRSRESREGRFAEELSACLNRPGLRANFMISIREDAYSRLGDLFQGRIDNVYGNYLHLENLNRAQAREAIERPVARFNDLHADRPPVEIDPALVDAVLMQLAPDRFASEQAGKGTVNGSGGSGRPTDAIAAPYLQLVMKRLWETELADGSRKLQLASLEHLGGAETIVTTHVDRALSDLSPQERQIALDIFRHLVTPSGTKIALPAADLAEYCDHSAEDVEALLERLASGDTRIVRPVPPPPDGDGGTRYEISHDLLAQATLDWGNRQRALRLESEKRAAEEETRAAEARALAEQERAQAERRRALRFRALAIFTGVLLIAGVVLAVTALVLRAHAVRDKQIAQARRLAAAAQASLGQDPELATLLSLQALRVRDIPEAETELRDSLPQLQLKATLTPPLPERSAMFSSSGTRILTASADGAIRIFDASSHHQIAAFPGFGALNSAALNRAGTEIVTANDDGTARIIDAGNGRLLGLLAAPDGSALSSASFSPNGRVVVTTGADAFARLWDVRTHRQLRAIDSSVDDDVLLDAQFSPDGKRIVTAGDLTVKIWDAATGKELFSPASNLGFGPLSVSFSPDGREVVGTDEDGTAEIWNAANGNRIAQLSPGSGQSLLFAAAFSPNGEQVLTAGADGVLRTWSAATHRAIRSFGRPGSDAIMEAGYSPDGKSIVTASAGGVVRVWNSSTGRVIAVLPTAGGSNRLDSVAFSPDGRLAVTGSHFGALTIWKSSPQSGGKVAWKPLNVIGIPENDAVNGVAFNANGTELATANQSGWVYLWSLPSGHFLDFIPVSTEALHSVQFDPANPNRLLAAGDDGYAHLYGLTNDEEVGRLGPGNWPMHDAVFSPNGKFIAAGSNDGSVRIWRTAGRTPFGATIDDGNTEITSVAFSSDGRELTATDTSGYATVFDARSRQHGQITYVTEPGGSILSGGAFLPSGSLIATAGSDGTARIWDVNSQSPVVSFSGHTGPINQLAVNAAGSRIITASADGTAKIWATQPIEQRLSLPGGTDLVTVAYSPADPQLVATSNHVGTVTLWNLRAPARPLAVLPEPANSNGYDSAEFSGDGQRIVASGGNQQARIWTVSDTRHSPVVLDLNRHPGCTNPNSVTAAGINGAEFSPNNQLVVTGDEDGTACIWNAATGVPVRKLTEPTGASGGVTGVAGVGGSGIRWAAFSPNSQKLVTASDDGTARVWNVSTGATLQVLVEPSGEAISTAWFSPDGRLVVTASNDGTSRIWDAVTGRELETFDEPDHAEVSNANFSPDQRFVVSCSGSAHIWSVKTGQLVTSFQYGNTLSDCEFNTDSTQIAADGFGGVTRIFSTELAGSIPQLERLARQRVTRDLTAAEKKRYGIS